MNVQELGIPMESLNGDLGHGEERCPWGPAESSIEIEEDVLSPNWRRDGRRDRGLG